MARVEDLSHKARVRSKGQITLPKSVRELLNLEDGDDLIFSVTEERQVIIEKQKVIPPDQAWFWTERWQKMEHEVQADIEAGRVHHYANIDEASDALEELTNASDPMD